MYERFRAVMRAWYALHLFSGGEIPKPRDEPSIRTGDPDAACILLIGNGPCQGNGVLTYQPALPGQLSRAIKRRMNRAADIDYVGTEAMNMASATAWLADQPLDGYDLAVVLIGTSDAARLTSEREWERGLRTLLGKLRDGMPAGTEIAVGSIPEVTALAAHNRTLGRIADRHRRRLDRVTAAVTSTLDDVSFFPLSTPQADPASGAEVYRLWAESVAEGIQPLLERTVPHASIELQARHWDWSGGPAVVELASTGGSQELQRLAAIAQETFGVELAVVTLLNGDRTWYAMHTEVLPSHIPTELSYCRYTAQNGGPMIVPDARLDPRFADNPLIEVVQMPFYAGYPLQSSSGDTIGSFCLHSAEPQQIPLDEFRELAMQAQAELQRYETTLE
jgi:GAF domain-containing protein